ncbi:hypothetical protein DM01DRAFT_1338266 [Hesseltinella vesiculosa]|uniref:Uncharacterized protein n=1 Tax=Hesseltinella vesiculosa TaxID=101127 RepID=A0A1X2GBF7_9FUNG|nr:hypothetical protein DM01DRAFT_1338266 [Hesseltinella vesiculosa]
MVLPSAPTYSLQRAFDGVSLGLLVAAGVLAAVWLPKRRFALPIIFLLIASWTGVVDTSIQLYSDVKIVYLSPAKPAGAVQLIFTCISDLFALLVPMAVVVNEVKVKNRGHWARRPVGRVIIVSFVIALVSFALTVAAIAISANMSDSPSSYITTSRLALHLSFASQMLQWWFAFVFVSFARAYTREFGATFAIYMGLIISRLIVHLILVFAGDTFMLFNSDAYIPMPPMTISILVFVFDMLFRPSILILGILSCHTWISNKTNQNYFPTMANSYYQEQVPINNQAYEPLEPFSNMPKTEMKY